MRLFCLLILILALASPAQAAFKSSSDSVTIEQAWNPQPLADDIVLPMPCGLKMALRAVEVPQGALIRDKSFPMGINNNEDQDRQIYERQFPGHIAAPFTSRDLPAPWQKVLDKNKISNDSWYFIGKYEVSNMQWQAVMNALSSEGMETPDQCPAKGVKDANLPVRNISWFEAQDFLNRYNAWLVKKHLKDLPSFSGTNNIAFLRLPTEEEWEYAARGGSRVPPEWWADKDIFPFAEGKSLRDYAVMSDDSTLLAPLGIGSRLANPLGLHDTAGNVGEMVDGFFRFSIPDMSNGQITRRLHGASGGVLTKGGGFRHPESLVMPGSRDELALYTARGPARSLDLGMRVALAGLNVPNAQRLQALRLEARRYKLPEGPDHDLGETPLDAAKALAARAQGPLKADLEKLQERLEDQQQAQASANQKTLEQNFRSLLYQAETLRAFAFRYSATRQQLSKVRELLKQPLEKSVRANAKDLLDTAEKDLKDYFHSLQMGASYYKNTLELLLGASNSEIDSLFAQTQREYGGNTVFDQHMRQNLKTLKSYLAILRKKGQQALGANAILKGILPERHYELLPI